MAERLEIAGTEIPPGERRTIEIPVGRRYTRSDLFLPVEVIHGRAPGPRLFICAAVHGNEINGVEIIRRVLRRVKPGRLRGALIAVPIVNVYGFLGLSRYLPDRRDLNRCFPGSPKGSLAARLAHVFIQEIVGHATHGIDLHTGATHRTNLPQIRACLDQPETERLARAFGVPVLLNANLRDGSLRQEVLEREIPMLLYEAGEALRFEEGAIRAGVTGILSVMRALGVLPHERRPRRSGEPFVARSSHWVRAPDSGILRTRARPGSLVAEGQELGVIADPLGSGEVSVVAPHAGIVIGMTTLPLANEGDALFHIATFARPLHVASSVELFQGSLDAPDG
jgi:predicted deacylase